MPHFVTLGVLFILIFSAVCQSARILNVLPAVSRSHHILGSEITKVLADAGHDVTFVSCFKEEYTPKNSTGKYRSIVLTGVKEIIDGQMKEMNPFDLGTGSLLSMFIFGLMGTYMTELALNNTDMRILLDSGEKFDVLLLEQFGNEALKSLSTHFNAHLVIYSAGSSSWFSNHVTGNPSISSYRHEEMFITLPINKNFWQRLKSTIYTKLLSAFNHLYFYPKHDKLVKKYISPEYSVYDSLYNQSLMLINSHLSVTPAYPQVPQIVYVGGFHVKPPNKLPQDLQTYLDNSKEGVIFFSMGSVLKSAHMDVAKRDIIVRTFKKFKQNVLWKWEDELPDLPDNVKTSKWLPQSDLLGHPNLKLFITHCGYGSFTESVSNGKPMVALPIFADQPSNAQNVEEFGLGIQLDFRTLTEESFTAAIKEVLENPKYAENAKYRSGLYKDRQVKPRDDVIYWIEYVLKHNGARHLRVTYLDMPWYQYYLLDVAVFILTIIFGVIIVLKIAWRKLNNRRDKNEKVKTN